MLKALRHNWIGKPWLESLGILGIPFACVAVLWLLPPGIVDNDVFPESLWLFLIVFVDVGHVYSTIYRTYADRQMVWKHKNLFVGLPLLLLVLSVLVHSVSGLWFWRCLAYLAVYHFVRQQYGFLRIYTRREHHAAWKRKLDAFTIYGVTVFPVVYWHVAPGRHFNWFVANDFLVAQMHPLVPVFILVLFWLLVLVYLLSELIVSLARGSWNWQKNLIVTGTALSWYLGIVYYNSDLVFTFFNVLCHGIPYLTLVWIHGRKQQTNKSLLLKRLYGRFTLLLFLLPLFFLAYVEEGFWDALVWKEHHTVFPLFTMIDLEIPKQALNLVVPLLALPQLFHYVIDGFIWRIRNDRFQWTEML